MDTNTKLFSIPVLPANQFVFPFVEHVVKRSKAALGPVSVPIQLTDPKGFGAFALEVKSNVKPSQMTTKLLNTIATGSYSKVPALGFGESPLKVIA